VERACGQRGEAEHQRPRAGDAEQLNVPRSVMPTKPTCTEPLTDDHGGGLSGGRAASTTMASEAGGLGEGCSFACDERGESILALLFPPMHFASVHLLRLLEMFLRMNSDSGDAFLHLLG
jgi:hypothetical protein